MPPSQAEQSDLKGSLPLSSSIFIQDKELKVRRDIWGAEMAPPGGLHFPCVFCPVCSPVMIYLQKLEAEMRLAVVHPVSSTSDP